MQVNTLQKFDGHRHCGRKDINISANKVIGIVCARDCMCPLNFTIIIFSKVNGMECSHIRNFRFKQCSWVTNEISPLMVTYDLGGNLWNIRKKLLQFLPKTLSRRRKRKRKVIAKLFALHANAINISTKIKLINLIHLIIIFQTLIKKTARN